ncbi:MAG: phosphatase, partial [Sciscionella sp.]
VPPDAAAGRPHLARMLVRSGVVSSVNEAFDKLLATGGPYHLEKADTPVLDAISMIAAAGGVTVLAHAFAHHRGPTVNAEVIATLAEAGMTGLEVAHPDHDAATQAELRALAADLRLLPTGSSDYHGVNKCITLGQETTDPEVFHALCERAQGSTVIRR